MKNLFFIACMLIASAGFAQEQTSPVWPGCENEDDKKACFNQKLSQHVQEHYEYPKNEDGEYVRGKVTISFDIDEEGEVVVNSVEGPEPEVNQAAEEMIMKIPDMQPGTVKGEPKSRTFTVPFNF